MFGSKAGWLFFVDIEAAKLAGVEPVKETDNSPKFRCKVLKKWA